MTTGLRSELEAILSPDCFPSSPIPDSWVGEGSAVPVLVAPASDAQMAEVLARASQEGWRVRPAGLCSLPLGAVESSADIILSTRNLKAMVSYEPADLTFTAQAGLPWTDLQRATGENGQWLPLDPPGVRSGTLGGVVATGLSGPLHQSFGAPKDHVLGLTLVSGDGRILNWGGRVVKNVAGFDITRLTVGSWGSLGVVAAVSARLFPLAQSDLTIVLSGPSAEHLLPIAQSMALSTIPLVAVELLDPIQLPPSGTEAGGAEKERAGLALRFLASEVQAREVEERILKEVALEAVGRKGSVFSLWNAESGAFHQALEGWEAGAELRIRMSLLPSRMDTLLSEARTLGEGILTRPRVSAHVGWGVLRVSFSEAPGTEEAVSELVDRLRSLRASLTSAGGALEVSRGPKALHERLGPPGLDHAVARLIRGLRAEFDPAGILSPGRPVGVHP